MVLNDFPIRWQGIHRGHSTGIGYVQPTCLNELLFQLWPQVVMQKAAEQINKTSRSYSYTLPSLNVDSEVTITGDQLQKDLRIWLSPPDPSTNHNIARKSHHRGTATWFIQGDTFQEWKSTGSLFWIHGNRKYLSPVLTFLWPMPVLSYCSRFWKECLVVCIGSTLL